MDIKFYNTLTNKLELFKPIKDNEVSIYCCGPTVYNHPHIGNMRPVIIFDTLVRFLKYIGYNVKFVSNYTDIDDKIIKKALEEGVDENVISERYIKSYQECLEGLNCLKAYKNPKVTEYIDEIIKYIDNLVKIGAAYISNDEVLFDVTYSHNYGILSNIKLDELEDGKRIKTSDNKRNPKDFLLWKKTENGIKWETPWCYGRPGWHTECCVMIDSIFKDKIDIHGGGHDLIFPHHENEIAQAYATNKNTIANFWIHNGMINIENQKMSKSLGNFIFAKDALEQYGCNVTRILLLNCQYRSTLNLTDKTINDSKSLVLKIENVLKQLNLNLSVLKGNFDCKETIIDKFLSCLADDLNFPNAITELLEIIKETNIELRKKELDVTKLEILNKTLNDIVYILGLKFDIKKLNNEEIDLFKNYIDAKNNKDFKTSDILREKLLELKIL
ncbi:MAG: cysteine--tRNA ligase [Bacillales bacterium]